MGTAVRLSGEKGLGKRLLSSARGRDECKEKGHCMSVLSPGLRDLHKGQSVMQKDFQSPDAHLGCFFFYRHSRRDPTSMLFYSPSQSLPHPAKACLHVGLNARAALALERLFHLLCSVTLK